MPIRPAFRFACLAALLAASTLTAAQSDVTGRWSCVANGKEIDIRIANGEATVATGSDIRVLKRQEVRSGSMYTDGTIALRQKGPNPVADAMWIENGQATSLSRCLPVAQ